MKHNKSDYFNRIKKIRCSSQDQIQKLTDKYTSTIDTNVANKEKEVMTV